MKEVIALRNQARDRAKALIKDSLSRIECLHLQGGQEKEILLEFVNIKEMVDLFNEEEAAQIVKVLSPRFMRDLNYLHSNIIKLANLKDKVANIANDMAKEIKNNYYFDPNSDNHYSVIDKYER